MLKKDYPFLFFLFFFIRIFSYYFLPVSFINSAFSIIIATAVIYLLYKKNAWGWDLVALEIILGGSGNFLSIGTISLRTCLLIISVSIYFLQKIISGGYKKILLEEKPYFFISLFLYLTVSLSAFRGFTAGHNLKAIISDLIPYLFLLYYLPFKELLTQEKNKTFLLSAVYATVIGNAIFTLTTFIAFSSNFFILQDTYYHWFRDIANGKITDLGLNFYRIVLNEHLLLIPLLLYFLNKQINKTNPTNKFLYFFISLFLFALSLNLTRVYILALLVGLLFLFTQTNWKRWLITSIATIFLFIISFSSLHLAASRGKSLGWELFGVRLQSIVSPKIEDSSLSRLILLPKIIEKIKIHPFLGNGLGDTVTIYSPVVKRVITTTQFDWGYLEIIDELGIVGLLAWLTLIAYIVRKYFLDHTCEAHGYLSSLTSLLVINLTSPALFHVLGITWLAYLLATTHRQSHS